jgi:hypothetical protein
MTDPIHKRHPRSVPVLELFETVEKEGMSRGLPSLSPELRLRR